MTDSSVAAHDSGGSVRTYLLVGVLLAVSTVVEVQLPRLLADDRTLLIVSLLLSAGFKAVLVALFYMHLRYDSRVYSGIMLLALVLVTYLLVLVSFGHFTI